MDFYQEFNLNTESERRFAELLIEALYDQQPKVAFLSALCCEARSFIAKGKLRDGEFMLKAIESVVMRDR